MDAQVQSHMLNMKIIYAESVEEKSIDRFYNKHGKNRETHYEILGDGICFCLRTGHQMEVLVYE